VNKAIAQVIAQNHQGKITVESKVAQGMTFCVNLPVISTVLIRNLFVKASLNFG